MTNEFLLFLYRFTSNFFFRVGTTPSVSKVWYQSWLHTWICCYCQVGLHALIRYYYCYYSGIVVFRNHCQSGLFPDSPWVRRRIIYSYFFLIIKTSFLYDYENYGIIHPGLQTLHILENLAHKVLCFLFFVVASHLSPHILGFWNNTYTDNKSLLMSSMKGKKHVTVAYKGYTYISY